MIGTNYFGGLDFHAHNYFRGKVAHTKQTLTKLSTIDWVSSFMSPISLMLDILFKLSRSFWAASSADELEYSTGLPVFCDIIGNFIYFSKVFRVLQQRNMIFPIIRQF